MTDSNEPFPILHSQLCGIFLLIISTLGFIFYVLFMMVVFRRPRFKHKTYFVIAGWLGVADCICLLLMIGYATPCLIYRRNLSDSFALGGILNIGWFSGLFLILILGGDRYFCICDKDRYSKLYDKNKTIIYLVVCWVIGIAYSIPSFFACCPLSFDVAMMSWNWGVPKVGSKVLAIGEIIMVISITTLTYIFNGLVFRTIRAAQRGTSLDAVHEQRKSARERKVFIQFFITTIWLVIFDVPFITIGFITNPSHWFGYFVTLSYTINCSINGWVYCFMNRTIQREVRDMFRRGHRIRAGTENSEGGHRREVGDNSGSSAKKRETLATRLTASRIVVKKKASTISRQ